MKHRKKFRKFGRDSAHRKAMLANMAASLIQHERIVTTVEKAKDLRGVVERLITRAGEDTVANRRQVYNKWITQKPIVHKLFTELGPRYKNRPGGYTRVLRTGTRSGDAADQAIIELVDSPVVEQKLNDQIRQAQAGEDEAAKAAQALIADQAEKEEKAEKAAAEKAEKSEDK